MRPPPGRSGFLVQVAVQPTPAASRAFCEDVVAAQ
jgi:hypothetical protein